MAQQSDSLQQQHPGKVSPVVPLGTEQQLPTEQAWQLVSRLMGSLELDALIQAFAESASQYFDCAGVTFLAPEAGEALEHGELAEHHAQYGLTFKGEALGSLTLHARRPFSAGDLALAEQCIGLLITPLCNALKYEAALREARTDPLTQLLNRSTMEQSLSRELGLARRHGEEFCVVTVDLDEFKTVNDAFGHAAGDAVLRDLAMLLRRCGRESDLIYRTGGDEFVIALSHTSLAGARLLAERLRRAVGRNVFRHNGEELPVYVSIGVTALVDHDTVDSLLERADEALYEAKRSGRNQVSFW